MMTRFFTVYTVFAYANFFVYALQNTDTVYQIQDGAMPQNFDVRVVDLYKPPSLRAHLNGLFGGGFQDTRLSECLR